MSLGLAVVHTHTLHSLTGRRLGEAGVVINVVTGVLSLGISLS